MTLDINRAASRMVTAVRDWSLGYGQGSGTGGRWDIRDGGAADCSSLVAWALNQAGITPTLGTDTYTGNLRARLAARGFQTLSPATIPQIGDVLLWEGHHTAMCVGTDTLAEAWINEAGTTTGGAPGDQTGQETRLQQASTHPDRTRWTHLLRPPTQPQEIDMQLSDIVKRPDGHTATVNDVLAYMDQRLEKLERILAGGGITVKDAAGKDTSRKTDVATETAWGPANFANVKAQTAALGAAVQTLATVQGLDPATITQTVQDAVDKALADVSITLTAKEN